MFEDFVNPWNEKVKENVKYLEQEQKSIQKSKVAKFQLKRTRVEEDEREKDDDEFGQKAEEDKDDEGNVY